MGRNGASVLLMYILLPLSRSFAGEGTGGCRCRGRLARHVAVAATVLLGFLLLWFFLGVVADLLLIGLLVATPLMAMVMVLVKMLYIEDWLGEPVELPGV